MNQLNFNDIFSNNLQQITADNNLTLTLIVFNIFFSGVIGVLIALIYRKYFMGVLFQKSFAVTLIVATMITTLVIMVISGNLILSLGMVGALSIVRFRAAIKDPLDVVYIFWAIGSGIAIGVSQYLLVFIALIAISFVLAILSKLRSSQKPKLLVINSKIDKQQKIQEQIEQFARKITSRSTQMIEDRCEMVFETNEELEIAFIRRKLIEIDGSIELRVLSYYGNN